MKKEIIYAALMGANTLMLGTEQECNAIAEAMNADASNNDTVTVAIYDPFTLTFTL